MAKFLFGILPMALIAMGLSGCDFVGEKTADVSTIYIAAALLSLLLLIGCLLSLRKKRSWFVLLFSSVLVVNTGYAILSLSTCLEMALWANRISYLGSVFLPLSMLMIILNATNTPYRKCLPHLLLGIAVAIFFIAASPGILDIYYKDVSFEIVNGVAVLVKVYGPLHPVYLVYLLGYFLAMVVVIIWAQIKKTIDTTAHAIVIAIAVFVNIGVWFIEQITVIEFEMLSVSYIISELFLLGVHLVMKENQQLRTIMKQVESVRHYVENEKTAPDAVLEQPLSGETFEPLRLECFINGLTQLTPTEREIYNAYTARMTTKEIMAKLNIKESTLKYHNRNLYSKLGVSSRKELLEIYKSVKAVTTSLGAGDNSV